MVFVRKFLLYNMKLEIKVYDVCIWRFLLIMICYFMIVLYKFVIKGFWMCVKGVILDLVNKIWMEYWFYFSKKYWCYLNFKYI